MADEHQNEHESRFSLEDLPPEVRQLADTMMGVNPNGNIQDWLIEQANMSMDLRPGCAMTLAGRDARTIRKMGRDA